MASTRTWRPVTWVMISAGSCTLASILSPSTVVTASSRPKGTWVSFTPGAVLQRDGGEMGEAAAAGVADAHLARIGLGVREELAQILPRRVGPHRERHRLAGERGHAGERRVVELHVARVIRGADAVRVPHHRVAVRGLALDVGVADGAAGPGAVDHRHRLPELLGRELGQLAGEEIGGAARPEEHGQLHGLGRERGTPRSRQDEGDERDGEPARERARALMGSARP